MMFRSFSRNPKDRVIAVPEWGSNSVIVSASEEKMEEVTSLRCDSMILMVRYWRFGAGDTLRFHSTTRRGRATQHAEWRVPGVDPKAR